MPKTERNKMKDRMKIKWTIETDEGLKLVLLLNDDSMYSIYQIYNFDHHKFFDRGFEHEGNKTSSLKDELFTWIWSLGNTKDSELKLELNSSWIKYKFERLHFRKNK